MMWKCDDETLFSFPILLDLQIPLPLEMFHFVIIRKQTLDAISATRKHS